MLTSTTGEVVLLEGGACFVCTGRAQGDMRSSSPGVAEARSGVSDLPWSTFRQVHGNEVVVVDGDAAGRDEDPVAADAAVLTTKGRAVAMLSADCAPVGLASPEGLLAVVHAGWRGLLAGVLEESVSVMRRLGASSIQALLGPCIRAECYAFGESDLDEMERRLGPTLRGVDRQGAPALDLAAGVRAALGAAGAQVVFDTGICTACSPEHWSWRARRDRQRQAMVGWLA